MSNVYDNEQFFNKYSQMERSKEGLNGAADWPTLKRLLPDFNNISVLDIGCGYGWHTAYASTHGARKVVGIDSSSKMLEVAKQKSKNLNIDYHLGELSDINFNDQQFDLVLSSLVIHYIEDYEQLVKDVHTLLDKDGLFIFNVEHPTFTANGSQDWHYNEDGTIMHFPVDNYYVEGARNAIFLGESMRKYHRTLTTYVMTLLNNGFQIEALVEAHPNEDIIHLMPDERRRPMMLMIKARKIDIQ